MPIVGPGWWLAGASLIGVLAGLGALIATRARRPADPSLTPLARATPADPSGPVIRDGPARLGRYRIDRPLGRGAMGTVYLGQDTEANAPVAVKTMAFAREFEGPALDQARERFFREAAMAGRLQHPDIVTIFGAGEEQGLAFVAMEFVDGHDLFRYTQPGRLLPVPVALHVVERVARALAYAHRQGVVHRDVKPANVMINAGSGTVKVTDFGIAHLADAGRTRTGIVLGTPSFMSPEQMAGGRLDGRADIYSLGVMLFQLLTGALPHAAESMGQLLRQIATEPAADVRTLRPELPEALARAIARALEKRSADRYADGDRMADDLLAVAELLEGTAGDRVGFEQHGGFKRAVPRHNPVD